MAHPSLDLFRGLALFDKKGRGGVAKYVKGESRFELADIVTARSGDANGKLKRPPALFVNVAIRMDASIAGRKNKIRGQLGTHRFPFGQGLEHDGRHRDFSIACSRFRRAQLISEVCSLPDLDNLAIEIHMTPDQSTKFGRAHSCEHSGSKKRVPACPAVAAQFFQGNRSG